MSSTIINDVISYYTFQNKPIGKTQLQKLVYLLKEFQGIELPYTYQMYHYGPYSFDLNQDLNFQAFLGEIDLKTSLSNCGYEITTRNDNISINSDIIDRLKEIESKIANIFDETENPIKISFLEMVTTFYFISKNYNVDEELINQFIKLKPKFNKDQVMKYYPRIKEVFLNKTAIST